MKEHEIVCVYKKIANDLKKTPTILEIVKYSDLSKRQINKYGHSNICKMAGLEPNLNSQQKKAITLDCQPPKILILDIETAPLLVRCYGLWQQNISTGFIVKDWYIFSFAAKWYGEKDFFYLDTRDTHENDLEVCNMARNLIDQADILVGHNLDRFDIKKLNTRFLKHNLQPVAKKKTIDTLKIAKRYFAITSNKLDFIAKFLGIKGKRRSKKYTNEQMWNGCCDGVLDCFIENEKYNKQDIKVTEAVFDKLKTWDESLNFQTYYGHKICVCGNKEFHKSGFRHNKQSVHQVYACTNCGKTHTGKENLIDKDARKEFFK